MGSVSSVGIGSGVLTSDLIDQLVEVEAAPTLARLDFEEQQAEAELSAFGILQNAASELQDAFEPLTDGTNLLVTNATSSGSAVDVTSESNAAPGQFALTVQSLATTQSLTTGVLPDQTVTGLGTGTLSISTGADTFDIAIDASNNTLAGIANAINETEGLDAFATVIDTGSGFQLLLSTSETGTANSLSISVTDDDGNNADTSGLSQFAFNDTDQNLIESVPATDAVFTVNGISITRSSNVVDDVLDGVTFTLNEESAAPTLVTITQDFEAAADLVQSALDAFNNLQSIINDFTIFDPTGLAATGVLLGDAITNSFESQTRAVLSQVVPGLGGSAASSLAEVGITTNADTGLLEFDRDAFTEVLAESPDDVIALFDSGGRTTDDGITFNSAAASTQAGTFAIDITQIATQGSFTGASPLAASTVIDADNDTFTIEVDGISSGEINLTQGTFTAAELAAELQAQINGDAALAEAGVSVAVSIGDNGELLIESLSFGDESTVNFSQVDTNTLSTLGIDAIDGVAGLDVAGTINGVEATGNGQVLTLISPGDPANLVSITVDGGEVGPRGEVTVIQGIATQLDDLFDEFLSFDGLFTTTILGLTSELTDIGEERLEVEEQSELTRAQLVQSFTAADILISQLNNTLAFLETNLAALNPGSDD